jgi:hypothetical protein
VDSKKIEELAMFRDYSARSKNRTKEGWMDQNK